MSRTEAFERLDFFGRALINSEKRKKELPCVNTRCKELYDDVRQLVRQLREELRTGRRFNDKSVKKNFIIKV